MAKAKARRWSRRNGCGSRWTSFPPCPAGTTKRSCLAWGEFVGPSQFAGIWVGVKVEAKLEQTRLFALGLLD